MTGEMRQAAITGWERENVVMTLNKRNEWVPAIPLPLSISLGRVQCTEKKLDDRPCHEKFWTLNDYRAHYALQHILEGD